MMMRKRRTNGASTQTGRALAIGLCAMLLSAGTAVAADAFAALDGAWTGKGSARFAEGGSEALRCTARYAGHGSNLTLLVRCASASAQIHLTSSLNSNGGMVSGGWSESAFGLSGMAQGSISGPRIALRISGGATGELTLTVAGDRHTLALTTESSALKGVDVSLIKR